jgi:hypothetical protein
MPITVLIRQHAARPPERMNSPREVRKVRLRGLWPPVGGLVERHPAAPAGAARCRSQRRELSPAVREGGLCVSQRRIHSLLVADARYRIRRSRASFAAGTTRGPPSRTVTAGGRLDDPDQLRGPELPGEVGGTPSAEGTQQKAGVTFIPSPACGRGCEPRRAGEGLSGASGMLLDESSGRTALPYRRAALQSAPSPRA